MVCLKSSLLNPLLCCRGRCQPKKISWEGGHGYCLSEKKKQNRNKAKVVGVLCFLAKVKKMVLKRTDCVNGLIQILPV
jgi:hypothetical protein